MRRAFGFLTVVGSARTPGPSTLRWFPVVGAVVGVAVGAVWWAAAQLWPALVAAVLAVIADVVLTGLLHVDGLADAADGLLPPVPRGRRLEIMATPDVGAFGVTAVAVVLLVRTASFSAIHPTPLLVAGLWCVARTLMAGAVAVLPYARPGGGLASAFRDDHGSRALQWLVLGGGLVLAGGLAGIGLGAAGVGAVVAAGVVGIAVLAFAHRRIGGFTGDVLGAAGMLAESAGLLVAGARW